jgi:hypothetical protein
MNENKNSQLEAAVDRELKALPNLRAPQTLLPRVMAVLEQRAGLPWYRRTWQTWPLPLQAVSMLVLLVAFAGLCLGSWQLVNAPAVASVTSEATGWIRILSRTLSTLGVLVNALALAVRSLGPLVLFGIMMALLLGYAACVGFGTLYVRLAFARR